MGVIWFVLIGMVAGWLAGRIMRGSGFGALGDIVVGILGAVLGGLLFNALHLPWGGLFGGLVVATVGTMLLIFIRRRIRRA